LFTNDEEVGLIGAKNLELELNSKYLLNLDSEDENIYIGSAGGVDAIVNYPPSYKKVYGKKGELKIDKLPGGHSGIDIDKDIPNAIIELIKRVKFTIELKGGEKRNSIPASATSIEIFEGDELFEVYDSKYINFLLRLPHGVLEYDFEYKIPSKSINFAIIDGFKTIFSLRANSKEKLDEVKEYLKERAQGYVEFENEYPAWEEEKNEFIDILVDVTKKDPKKVHAGLECAVLKEKYPHIKMASYGPIIKNPHTILEKVSISSVNRVLRNLEKIFERIENEFN
jgi:dipeptidase D